METPPSERQGLSAVVQFLVLLGVFTVVLAVFVGSVIVDKRQTMQVVTELKTDTVPLMIRQLRLSRNLDSLRFEAEQALLADSAERRNQGSFYVAVHARDLDFLTDAVVSAQVDELVDLLRQAADGTTADHVATWASLADRLKRSADQIAVEAIALGQQNVVKVEEDLADSLEASFYLLIVGITLQLLTLLYVGFVFIRPLKKLGAHLTRMPDVGQSVTIDLSTRTTEIQAIERAVNMLARMWQENRQMNSSLQESERLLRQEMVNAQQASRAKQDFISNVSHEIRTPLSTMAGMLYLLEKSGLTADQHRRLDLVRQCSNHLNGLITQVLDLSKIEAGMFKLEHQDFVLGDVLNESFRLFALEAAGKQLSYSMDVPESVGLMGLRGDALRIRQVIMNLLSNAIKFTGKGSVLLRAEHVASAERKVQIKVSVADTGIGMSASEMEQLFQNFSQVDGTKRRGVGGTGLGLAISRKLVDLMEGDIGVRSQVGSGAEFWFTIWVELAGRMNDGDLLCAQSSANQSEAEAHRTDAKMQQAARADAPLDPIAHLVSLVQVDDPVALNWLHTHETALEDALGSAFSAVRQAVERYCLADALSLLRQSGHAPETTSDDDDSANLPVVLLVDDTPSNITYLCGLLDGVCRMRVATTGQRAMACLRSRPLPALMILDIAMPGQDGFSTLELVKSDPGLKGTPVVLISASVTPQAVEKALRLGAIELLDRVLSPQHLREKITQVLQPAPVSA